ncbi:MAG: hypothetical protein HY023_16210 [Chloroflexi bacterium]|nr:hypothetical protein [Chloroflexota bacterium]
MPSDASVYTLVIDPVISTTLYAGYHTGTSDELFKSTDAGATWSPADAGLPTDPSIRALAIDPRTPSTLYAAIHYPGSVFKSTDAGATWNRADDMGLPADVFIQALIIDPGRPTTLYVAVGLRGGVFQTDDGGANWRLLNTGQQFSRASALAIDPLAPTTLYAATDQGVFSIQQVAVCAGDCSGLHTVAIDDLITLVNIALGTAEPATCAAGGLPIGGEVDIAVVVEAVNNAMKGCA